MLTSEYESLKNELPVKSFNANREVRAKNSDRISIDLSGRAKRTDDYRLDVTPEPIQTIEGPAILLVRHREVYIQSEDGKVRRKIGVSNRAIKTKKLVRDPILNQERALELVSSCISDKTKSSSPSMILHQVASISLSMSLVDECMFEEKGKYTPDLTILPESDKMYVDVTGVNTERKLEEVMKKLSGCVVIINKYQMLSSNSSDMALLFKFSRLNDRSDVNFLYEQAEKYADHSGLKLFYKKSTLSFFVNQRDKLMRSLEKHYVAAETVFKEFIRNGIQGDRKVEAIDFREELRRAGTKVYEKCKIRYGETLETKVYCFMEEFDYETSVDSKKIEVRTELRDAVLSLAYEVPESNSKLFERIEVIRVHPNYYISTKEYSDEKRKRDLASMPSIFELLEKYNNCDMAYYEYMSQQISNHSNFTIDNKSKKLVYKTKVYKLQEDILPLKAGNARYLNSKSWLINKKPMDPDHVILLENEKATELIGLISCMRDYNDLRFRARVAAAIMINKKSGSTFKVSHWATYSRFAEVKITGMLFETDGGTAVVSYFEEGILCRTEKWRLPDVENYSVGHHRLIGLSLALYKNTKSVRKCLLPIKLYARIISENSWGLSEFLKTFRYFSTGYLVSSPEIRKQADKMIKSLNKSSSSKMSTLMICECFLSQTRTSVTPAFGFEYADLGWEIFLINLCPSKTYGRRKHLSDVLRELYAEINLYNSNLDSVSSLYDDFDSLLSARDLVSAYRSHLQLVLDVSGKTLGRFSYSPMCTVLQYKSIQEMNIKYHHFQSNLPVLSDLMTAKASTDPVTKSNTIAAESIRVLAERHGTASTSMLILKCLGKRGVVDLSMRMFDKDAVGSNREISILSSEFRLVQVCLERFFWSFSNLTDNSMIHRKDKIDELYRQVENALSSKAKLLATIDQTRWGPNNNTVKYGLLAAMMCKNTTEAYLPVLVALIMEFKVFEVPPWLDEHYDEIDNGYFLPGKTGRSHMGQGICQDSSTADHALVANTIQRIFAEIIKEHLGPSVSRHIRLNYSSLITSDDAAMINYVSTPIAEALMRIEADLDPVEVSELMEEIDSSLPMINELYVKLYSFYSVIILFFGILTSDYKNMFVGDSIEFNCEFLSSLGIGSNELKFIYSLISPHTTGSFTLDYKAVLDTYYSSTNSGCKRDASNSIVYLNYLRFCRQWKMRPDIVGYPSRNTILYGILPTVDKEQDSYFRFDTGSHLRYNTRNVFKANLGTSIQSVLANIKLESISNSREKVAYRSCISYGDCKEKIVTCSPYYDMFEAIGETCESFVYHQNRDEGHYTNVLNPENQVVYSVMLNEKHTKPRMFQKKTLVTSKIQDMGTWELVLSTRDRVNTISSSSSDDELYYHLLRDMRTGEMLEDEHGIKELSLPEKLRYINEIKDEIDRKTAGCVSYVFNKNKEQQLYLQTELIPPLLSANVMYSFNVKIPSTRIDTSKWYSRAGEYVAAVRVNTQGNFELVEEHGYIAFNTAGYTLTQMNQPSLEEMLGFIDEEIIKVNDMHNEEEGVDYAFINFYTGKPKYESQIMSTEERESLMQFDIHQYLKEMGEENERLLMGIAEHEDEVVEDELQMMNDLFSQGSTKNYYSIAIDKRYSVFSGRYFRNRIPMNAMIWKLIEMGAIVTENNLPGYLLNDISAARCLVTDKSLARKLHIMNSQVVSNNVSLTGKHRDSWINLSNGILDEDPFLEILESCKVCLLAHDPLIQITTKPLGEILSKRQFREMLDIELNL